MCVPVEASGCVDILRVGQQAAHHCLPRSRHGVGPVLCVVKHGFVRAGDSLVPPRSPGERWWHSACLPRFSKAMPCRGRAPSGAQPHPNCHRPCWRSGLMAALHSPVAPACLTWTPVPFCCSVTGHHCWHDRQPRHGEHQECSPQSAVTKAQQYASALS